MDTSIIAALIGAVATIIAAVITARIANSARHVPNVSSVETQDEETSQGQARRPSVPHAGVTRFYSEYWQFAKTEYPQLVMKQPGQVPAGSGWPAFRNPELNGRRIVHKWPEGFMDLEIGGAGEIVDKVRAENTAALAPDMEVVRTTKSASIRLKVPPLDRFREFAQQREAASVGLKAAVRLLELSPKITVPERGGQ